MTAAVLLLAFVLLLLLLLLLVVDRGVAHAINGRDPIPSAQTQHRMGLPTVGELYGSSERLKYLSTNTRLQLRRAQHSNEGAVAEFLQTASHMSCHGCMVLFLPIVLVCKTGY